MSKQNFSMWSKDKCISTTFAEEVLGKKPEVPSDMIQKPCTGVATGCRSAPSCCKCDPVPTKKCGLSETDDQVEVETNNDSPRP